MSKSFEVRVKPGVFVWLRTSSGWTVEDVGKRLKTSVDSVKEFESGKKAPTLRQLKELSCAYKRPLAAFLLSKQIDEKPMPEDFRMLPREKGVFDKKTIYIIRKARHLQEIGKELSRNIDYSIQPIIKKVKTSDKPESIAEQYRNQFGLTEEKRREFRTSYELFNYLRDIFEDMNILVFQFSMPIDDARGFTLTDETPNVVVVSSKDNIEARLFSLMHEFGHVLLGETVVDLPDISITTKDKVEHWCNEFSSSFFLPRDLANDIFTSQKKYLTETKTLNTLSHRYKVSKAMLLYNMLKLKYITKEEYESTIDRFKQTEPKPKDEGEEEEAEEKTGGIPADRRCLSEMGNKFVSIVANNYDLNHITYTDALNYLSIRSRNFDKVLAKARK